jgi:DNA repair protein RecO (recombination protein O)
VSRSTHRVQLARAYVLHQRPFRDSSLILEAFTHEHGRQTLFAHGARGPRSRFALLQPFRALLLSWSGRGEAATLAAAESVEGAAALPAAQLLSAFYLNELLLKLLSRGDPHPELFDHYESTLARLRRAASAGGAGGAGAGGGDGAGDVDGAVNVDGAGAAEVALRLFEARLLDLIGYGLNLVAEADTGKPVRSDGYYYFRPGVHGFVVAEPAAPGAIAGQVLRGLALGALSGEGELRTARALMRAALDHCLEGRELTTRSMARSLASYPRRQRGG